MLLDAFHDFGALYWKQTRQLSNTSIGDFVYIYAGMPESRILVVTKIAEKNVPRKIVQEDRRLSDIKYSLVPEPEYLRRFARTAYFLKLVCVKTLEDMGKVFHLDQLRNNGLRGSVQGAYCLENHPTLLRYLERYTGSK
jgi:hypothetical protein